MNSPTPTQKAHEQLLTTASPFHNFQYLPESRYLLQVLAGAPAIDALNSSSCLLAAATSFCNRLMDEDAHADEIYGLRFMLEASRAFVISATRSVEFSNRLGGAQ